MVNMSINLCIPEIIRKLFDSGDSWHTFRYNLFNSPMVQDSGEEKATHYSFLKASLTKSAVACRLSVNLRQNNLFIFSRAYAPPLNISGDLLFIYCCL